MRAALTRVYLIICVHLSMSWPMSEKNLPTLFILTSIHSVTFIEYPESALIEHLLHTNHCVCCNANTKINKTVSFLEEFSHYRGT